MEQRADVSGVEVVGDFRLRLTFEDGTVGEIDFAERAWRGVFEPLRDPACFARVRVDPEAGTIAWPNGVDMAPEHLYEQARRNPSTTSPEPAEPAAPIARCRAALPPWTGDETTAAGFLALIEDDRRPGPG